ncbi:MAG: hypothetical protein ABH854_04835 [Candidatus Diapherotrites archaeon]|nr:hypothetical protein [Candidatus Micrarchaeota archaeon]MBU1939161.1 hypothetical protein [Candidatus Micrarchaeota archaeon]
MPVKPLPYRLIKKLIDSKGNLILTEMQIVDHRAEEGHINTTGKSDKIQGGRVRGLKVSGFPGIGRIVLKRTHGYSATDTIKTVQGVVKNHKPLQKRSKYILAMPHAYAIGPDLIAMAESKVPTVTEILHNKESTAGGKKFFHKIKSKYGVTEKQLLDASKEAMLETGIRYDHMLVIGYDKGRGKFKLMPLMDVY